MKVLVIGSGGREHAICWKLRQSPLLSELFCAPGNPGIAQIAKITPIAAEDVKSLADFAEKEKIELTIVGPEISLSAGVVDEFQKRNLKIFGPSQSAAKLESSKAFAKEVMQAASVVTAKSRVFSELGPASDYCASLKPPLVIKADGLAAGKGVLVTESLTEANKFLQDVFKSHGKVVIEDFLEGVEASFIVATNGTDVVPLATSHDYKRLLDGQRGPNTGGMGTVSPTTHLTDSQSAWALENVIRPVLKEMQLRGTPFQGFLYAGLMISSAGKVSVVEFNARLGDPETQVIMARMKSDLLQSILDLMQMKPVRLEWHSKTAVCVVQAAKGYPDNVEKGDEISGLEQAQAISNCLVLQAGTAIKNGKLVVNGGRVLNVIALGADVAEARQLAYKASDMIQFRGKQLRRDIGH